MDSFFFFLKFSPSPTVGAAIHRLPTGQSVHEGYPHAAASLSTASTNNLWTTSAVVESAIVWRRLIDGGYAPTWAIVHRNSAMHRPQAAPATMHSHTLL